MTQQEAQHAGEQPPFPSEYVTVDGLNIRLARNSRTDGPTVLLLSPLPESLYAFTPVWQELSEKFRLVAVDLPGFGQSEGDAKFMTPNGMADFVIRLAEHLGLTRIHGIGPDIGTPTLLAAAAAKPELFESLIVGSGATSYPLKVEGLLKDFVEAESAENFRGVDMKQVVDSLFTFDGYSPSQFVRNDYVTSYTPDRFVDSLAFIRSYPSNLEQLNRDLASVQVPVQIIVGRNDPFIPLENAEDLHRSLSRSSLAVLDSGHLPWEESFRKYGTIAEQWIEGGYRSA
ncbi:alpha/beta hydrolase [Streptomyces sp. NPDC096934]|uniref:alpha/beta fold hydrolase n=1 Tax=Streptomyces sp. NPDC096934 TaxID=3155551 RepID=UPI0033203F7C